MIMQKIFLFNNFPKNLIKKSQIERLVNEIYTVALENIDLDKAKCNICNSIGDFEIKGYYIRSIIINYTKVKVRILRVKCKNCGKTHAILFLDFIPYYSMSSSECKRLFDSNFNDQYYDVDLIYHLKKRIIKFMNRIRQIGISFYDSIFDITVKIINFRMNSFLQIHRGTVITFL